MMTTVTTIDNPRQRAPSPIEALEAQIDPGSLSSCLYQGIVSHSRLTPEPHEFRYRLSLYCINLDEIDEIFRLPRLCSTGNWSLIQFRRSDYHGSEDKALKECVRETVRQHTGLEAAGPIRLLTSPRYYGFVCNPVSFYYCYSADGRQLEAILAEVTNTPWGERHSYVIPWQNNKRVQNHKSDKEFHVSPFMPMELSYLWKLSLPGEYLTVEIENHDSDGIIFSASLSLQQHELSATNVAKATIRFPWMTAKIFLTIYWQAFKLWRKKVPFHPHPSKLRDA